MICVTINGLLFILKELKNLNVLIVIIWFFMTSYDLIIVSQSSSQELIDATQRAIDSCLADCPVNVILVETFAKYDYRNVNITIRYIGDFNYNRALNMGLTAAHNDIHILANNDIIFQSGWSKIGDIMKSMGYLSASALSTDARQSKFQRGDFVYEGYEIGSFLTGWCIFIDKTLPQKICRLDERFNFWYSDNVYADQLKRAGIKHALICNCQVDHITSLTLSRQTPQTKRRFTLMEMYKYAKGQKVHGGDCPVI